MEAKIVKKAIKGHKKSFDQLMNIYSHDAYRLAYYYLNHQADSQDALGFAIEKAYKKIKTLKEAEKFKAWFMTIVVNEAKMILRQRKLSVISLETYPDQVVGLATEMVNEESVLDLKEALKKLSEEDRSLIMLKHYEGYTFSEISKLLNLPEGTVKTRNYKLLELLKRDLEGKEANDD